MLKSLIVLAVVSCSSASAAVLKLTNNDYKEKTDGKTVFIKAFAPWCGHCKSMAPDWEKLANDWEKQDVGLVAEIDCTAPDSEDLCQEFNVEGFPTLLYGDPSSPEEYQGGRDYESLSEFAKTFLDKPVCSISKTDSCSDKEKSTIAKVSALAKEELLKTADSVKSQINAAQKELDDFIDQINTQYETMTTKFNQKVDAIKADADFKWVQQALTKLHGVKPHELDGEEDERDEL